LVLDLFPRRVVPSARVVGYDSVLTYRRLTELIRKAVALHAGRTINTAFIGARLSYQYEELLYLPMRILLLDYEINRQYWIYKIAA
jgi:hypothetical protein